MTESRDNSLTWAWKGALLCFILAGATGVLFRIGMIAGLPSELQFENVRHAHSHLMYFGWVTPALMAMIASYLGRASTFSGVIWIVFFLALGSYTPFLLYGYGSSAIGELRLPLSVIFAGANIMAWYTFAGLYVYETRGESRNRTIRFFDAGLAFLIVASLGAWGLAPIMMLRPENPFWFQAALHLFLDLFADGWLTLGLLGLAYAALDDHRPALSRWGQRLLLIGLPVTVLLGVPVALVPHTLRLISGFGGILVGSGLLPLIAALWPGARRYHTAIWTLPLSLLTLKAPAQIAISIPSIATWAESMNLRILYLHTLLLGVATLGLLAAAQYTWTADQTRGWRWVAGSIVLLLLTLLPLTGLWPGTWRGPWVFYSAVLGAALPVITVGGLYAATTFRTTDPTPTEVSHTRQPT
jgi:hypothetical protein